MLYVVSLQALDGDFSEDNRNKCRLATTPLIDAVDNLTAFASNPEFVSVPAQISSEVGSLQEGHSRIGGSFYGTEQAWKMNLTKLLLLFCGVL